MNWCKPHWQQLRDAIEAKGLSGFGAKTGEQAARNLATELEGAPFDPLMGCWSRINSTMAESLNNLGRGQELLQLPCPLCVLVKDGQPELVARWIDGCTDNALKYAKEQGLVGQA